MCGILVFLQGYNGSPEVPPELETDTHSVSGTYDTFLSSMIEPLARRGPSLPVGEVEHLSNSFELRFIGSVLHLRGPEPVAQPLTLPGHSLLFNGEVFGGLEMSKSEHDGTVILDKLKNCSGDLDQIRLVLESIRGPWAIVYYHEATQQLIFARDRCGRRSLLFTLLRIGDQDLAVVSSVAPPARAVDRSTCVEIPPSGVYSCRLGPSKSLLVNLTPFSPHEIPRQFATIPPEASWNQWLALAESFTKALTEAVDIRVSGTVNSVLEHQAPVAVLFSGGVDSTLLALLAAKASPDHPLDLINVAFYSETEQFNVPDRITALAAFEELSSLLPDRKLRLHLVNVYPTEIGPVNDHIVSLMYPCDALMDVTISTPLWFASRGQVRAETDVLYHPYQEVVTSTLPLANTLDTSTRSARVLLVGHGADELLGGYGRHRTALLKGGWNRLLEELELDYSRLWKRNLGRDDRILSDCGREARHPYLDESLSNWIRSLPPWYI